MQFLPIIKALWHILQLPLFVHVTASAESGDNPMLTLRHKEQLTAKNVKVCQCCVWQPGFAYYHIWFSATATDKMLVHIISTDKRTQDRSCDLHDLQAKKKSGSKASGASTSKASGTSSGRGRTSGGRSSGGRGAGRGRGK